MGQLLISLGRSETNAGRLKIVIHRAKGLAHTRSLVIMLNENKTLEL